MDFPDIPASQFSLTLQHNTHSYESPLTGATQTSSLPGTKWKAVATYSNKQGADARKLKAFVMGLKGRTSLFNYFPPDLDQQGQGAAPITVNGNSQLGGSINIKSTDLNTLLFGAGDYLTVNGELKTALADCSTDGAGLANVLFAPDLRKSPAHASTIEYQK